MKFNLQRPYVIVWVDSHSLEGGVWHVKEDMDQLHEQDLCSTMGWVYKDDEKFVSLYSSMTKDQVSGSMAIPKLAIQQYAPLQIGEMVYD